MDLAAQAERRQRWGYLSLKGQTVSCRSVSPKHQAFVTTITIFAICVIIYYFSFNPHTFYLDLFEKKTLSTHNLPVKPKVKCAEFFFLIIHWLKYATIKIQKQSVLMYT